MIGDQVKVLCGTPEFVAPEVVNYDFISTGSGEIFNQVNSYHICFALLRTYVSEIGREYLYCKALKYELYKRLCKIFENADPIFQNRFPK